MFQTQDEKLYEQKYGGLPDTQEALEAYILQHYKVDMKKVKAEEERIRSISWKEVNLTIPIVPKASPRPRYSSQTDKFYVKGAKQTKQIISQYVEDYHLICTRVEFYLTVYQPTPNNMNAVEVYLAEKGLIRPISKPDFDNVAKTYSDALQEILLLNDNIINPGCVEKYYSIKPRINILLRYQESFDSAYNEKKIMSTLAYRNYRNSLQKGGISYL